jgi:hypothetical protein
LLGESPIRDSVELAGLDVAFELVIKARGIEFLEPGPNASSSLGGSFETAFSISSIVVMP